MTSRTKLNNKDTITIFNVGLKIGKVKINAPITKSAWSKGMNLSPGLMPSLLLKKLFTESPVKAPKPIKNPNKNHCP